MLAGMREVRIGAGAGEVSASLHGGAGTLLALGHGAGGDRRAALLVDLAEEIAASGRRALLFNFPYTEARRRAPDPGPVLEATVEAVASWARRTLDVERLVLGGKSMGGRIASQAVARGLPADGLVFLGYPLHPPGRPAQLRDRHLPAVSAPMLFVQGTRDAFAPMDRLRPVLDRLGARATLHLVEGGGHSFEVPRRAGRPQHAVLAEVFRAVLSWLDTQRL